MKGSKKKLKKNILYDVIHVVPFLIIDIRQKSPLGEHVVVLKFSFPSGRDHNMDGINLINCLTRKSVFLIFIIYISSKIIKLLIYVFLFISVISYFGQKK